jgi:hypothetical protein
MFEKQNPARTGGAAGPGGSDVFGDILPISRHPSFVQSPQRHRPVPRGVSYEARISVMPLGRTRAFALTPEALERLIETAEALERAGGL